MKILVKTRKFLEALCLANALEIWLQVILAGLLKGKMLNKEA
jgi:hypothetical protein